MNRRIAFGLALALALVPNTGRAATLPFTGTLTLQLGAFLFVGAPANRLVLSASGTAQTTHDGSLHLLSLSLPGGRFGPATTSVPLPPLTHPSTLSVRWTAIRNEPGSFGSLSGGPPGGGAMGVQGLAKICLIFDFQCDTVFVPFFFVSGTGAGFGIGGTQVFTEFAVNVTQRHAPWTLGQPVITVHYPRSTVTTPMLPGGFAHGPASATSSTAQPGGALQLVTVTRQFTNLTGAFPERPLFGVLELHFVPEPGTLLLLASGGVAVAAARRRRRARPRG